jgi:hypothetical protein
MEVMIMYKDKFVLSVLVDGYPVKETGPVHKRQVAIPFDKEYIIRLKNKHNRSCTAKVFIDGMLVSALGDVIICADSTIDLERFIDSSLTSGNKFKFVSLDHPEVDDPTSSDNGIIKVEFRLAKGSQIIVNQLPNSPFKPWPTPSPWNDGTVWYRYDDVTYSSGPLKKSFNDSISAAFPNSCNYVNCNAAIDNGATIEGGHSSQSFTYSHLDVEDTAVVLKLQMVGLKKSDKIISLFKYCSNCGSKAKRTNRYCSECGRRV